MTLGLTYSPDLSRVQIAVTGPPSGTTVHIERSLNGLYWETVRGGAAVPVVGGTATLDDYEFGADRVNYYRYTGEAPAPVAAAASDPAASDPAVAPSVDAPTAGLLVTAWTSYDHNAVPYTIPGSMTEVAQQTGQQWAVNAVATETVTAGATGTRSASIGVADAWSAASVILPGAGTVVEDVQSDYFHWSEWAEPGDGASVTTISAEPGWWAIAITACDYDNSGLLPGRAPGEGWTMIAASPAGESSRTVVWAREITDPGPVTAGFENVGNDDFLTVLLISGLADGTGAASITPDLDGKVWLKSIRYPFLNRAVTVADVAGDTLGESGAVYDIQGRSMPVAVTSVRSSETFTLTVRTTELAEARDMDLILKSGAVFFIHVPAGSQIPGGYVHIGKAARSRFGPVSTRRLWPLPCRIVAPPGPGVVGGTMTYRALLGLYGSYAACLAANPTYADLLDLMASLDDLVVL